MRWDSSVRRKGGEDVFLSVVVGSTSTRPTTSKVATAQGSNPLRTDVRPIYTSLFARALGRKWNTKDGTAICRLETK